MHNTLTPSIQAEFEKAFGSQFVTSLAVREHHAQDESAYDKTLPEAVIFARSVEDVVQAVKLCNTHNIPVVAFGAGTSIEGHILPIHGGITLDLSEMNKVLSVDDQDFTVTVEPGVLRHQLNDEIRHTGLYFPIDPGANA
ncbi:MAG: FAD-binding oxidoreductase, partial [Pelistega sp.]|nr:FAD-binding oxidoreductase [Pelistega sp.]